MSNYIQIPQCNITAPADQIIDLNLWVYDTGSRKLYYAMPAIGNAFNRGVNINENRFKMCYYEDTNFYWCVIGTIPNVISEKKPAVYSVTDTVMEIVITEFSNNLTPITYNQFAFAKTYTLNPRIPVYETLEDCLAAMNDGSWEYDPNANDPYENGGSTSGGGGTGDFDNTGDSIDFPSLPTLSAADTGFITLFNPNAAQLKALANYMWSNPLFDLDAWKKIFADPMDAILGLSIVPVNVPSGGAGSVTVGNISTGVSMTKAAAQYVEVDCGSLNVKEYWGAYLDYSPYTKCYIHLPYCGIHPIDIDDIMNKSVHVKYHIDILSGACCAYVKCGDSVLYEFAGQCAASIPITGDNWTNVINGVMQIAASIGSMAATGGLSSPVTASDVTSIGANIGSTIMSMKPSIEKSGSLGGVGGMLAIQKPYLILTRKGKTTTRVIPHL